VFGITEFYYLRLIDSTRYELKVGMYDKGRVSGKYETQNDTLKLKTFDLCDLSEKEKVSVERNYSEYLIKDSLLIPIRLLQLNLPRPSFISHYAKLDSVNSDWFILSDGHVSYNLKLRNDSLFTFSTSACRGGNSIEGKWLTNNTELIMNPITQKRLETLRWICTNYKMVLFENFLIGKNIEKNKYMYLLKR
jgi:hypothetical protein